MTRLVLPAALALFAFNLYRYEWLQLEVSTPLLLAPQALLLAAGALPAYALSGSKWLALAYLCHPLLPDAGPALPLLLTALWARERGLWGTYALSLALAAGQVGWASLALLALVAGGGRWSLLAAVCAAAAWGRSSHPDPLALGVALSALGWLPLLRPARLLPALPLLGQPASLAFLVWAAAGGAQRLDRKVAAWMAGLGVLQGVMLGPLAPWNHAFPEGPRPLYAQALAAVPAGASVSADAALTSHLPGALRFPAPFEARGRVDVVVLDLRGPAAPLTFAQRSWLLARLLKIYGVAWFDGRYLVLRQGAPPGSAPAILRRLKEPPPPPGPPRGLGF